jgi:hypothetical protein
MSYIGNEPFSVAFLTDTFSGNGSTTAFTLSAAPAGTSSILVAITGVVQDPSTYSVVGTTLTFSPAPPSGTGNISVRFLGIPASGVTTTAYRTVTEFTATAGQTTFSVPSYTVGFIDVYRNGVMLGSADYTASNGVSVVLASGATAGDLVEVISFSVSSVLNAIPGTAGSVGSSNLASSLSLVTPRSTTTIGVGNATPAASGAGITFPATQSASSDANTLDDYEEGSWTPVISGTGSNPTVSYSSRGNSYTKIGRLVYLTFDINISSISGGSGDFAISGVPFLSGGTNTSWGTGVIRDASALTLNAQTNTVSFWADSGTNNLFIQTMNATGNLSTASVTVSSVSTGRFNGTIVYWTP